MLPRLRKRRNRNLHVVGKVSELVRTGEGYGRIVFMLLALDDESYHVSSGVFKPRDFLSQRIIG